MVNYIKTFNQLFEDLSSLRYGHPGEFEPVIQVDLNKYKRNPSFFDTVNSELRSGKEEDLDRVHRMFCNNMDEAIKNKKTKDEIEVYRIVDMDEEPINERPYPKPKSGSKLTDPGYMSTSIDMDYLESQTENYEDPLIITIKVPAGTPYYMFSKDDFESEILFGRNHTLTYTSDPSKKAGYTVVNATMS